MDENKAVKGFEVNKRGGLCDYSGKSRSVFIRVGESSRSMYLSFILNNTTASGRGMLMASSIFFMSSKVSSAVSGRLYSENSWVPMLKKSSGDTRRIYESKRILSLLICLILPFSHFFTVLLLTPT